MHRFRSVTVVWGAILALGMIAASACGGASQPTEAPTVLPTVLPTAIVLKQRQPSVTSEQVKANLARSPYLDRTHTQQGVDCIACHKAGTFDSIPAQDVCLTCHGPKYADLAVKTAKQTPNPHNSHLNDEECSTCHGAHRPFVYVCAQCHSEYSYKGRFATE
jgi:hypothetical protein